MFDPERFIEEQTEKLAAEIDGKTIIAVSGGVDSTVAAILMARAVGEQLFAVYVNNGFMRKNEDAEVAKTFEATGVTYKIVDASDEFFESLKGVIDPEEKRKIIGNKFIEIFEREAIDWGAEYLVQGTIAPDWIESGGQLRDTIKSHHNVGGLPSSMKLRLVEPLRDLYKDEVRKVARSLGISVSERQPFPGPALAIRILGEVTPERVEVVREACAIAEEEIEKAAESGKMDIPWQYFAVLLPLKSVGVHGDVRAYGNTVAVRAVESVDGMTAKYMHIPHDVLETISVRITNEIKSVNRVVYDITHKPPATIEWE
ncbi:MAG: glutamine-hydrolyzing GMP synthase subunit GuaA [Thermoplasmata archaeon]|nr:glutamine-hydrolyzing GMP synthase subunit GuaA [Thermoplasmata archaeon]MCK4455051.1 glutamine-hydrolyzing GMP synthase subunit GuaA [Thermoplasmata archaeon]